MVVNLTVKFLDKLVANPTVLASGVLGITGASLAEVCRHGAGAVTMKSVSLEPRPGHPNPVMATFAGGMINAVGLSNPGIEAAAEEVAAFRAQSEAPLMMSIFGGVVEEFGRVARKAVGCQPDFLEVNISCPNVESEFGKPFAADPRLAAEVTKVVKKEAGHIPVLVKLSPNVASIAEIGKAVVAAGADALVAINTVGPGMIIEPKTAKPILSNGVGGLSGAAIKPIAVRCVYELSKAVPVPIIGLGGVETGLDAIEMMEAGATLVGIGSGVYSRGLDIFNKVTEEIKEFMKEEGVEEITTLIGKVHEYE